MIKPSTSICAITLLVLLAAPVHAQESESATPGSRIGYTTSAEPVFEQPSPSAQFLGTLAKGTHVHLRHEGSEWYAVYLPEDEEERVGYVFGATLQPAPPDDVAQAGTSAPTSYITTTSSQGPDADDAEEQAATPSGPLGTRYVHQFANVRGAPSSDAAVVAQLPPGSRVHADRMSGGWAEVYADGEAAEALGYVSAELLQEEAPSRAAQTIVYITRTGTKYHEKGCRHLRNSQFSMTLEEVLEKSYEPCKVCRPPTGEQ